MTIERLVRKIVAELDYTYDDLLFLTARQRLDLVSKIRAIFGVDINIGSFYTVGDLARFVAGKVNEGEDAEPMIFDYKGSLYPDYLKRGNACRFIKPIAQHFCRGRGVDVGAGPWPLEGAYPVDIRDGRDAMDLPKGQFDYVFSSHCLEHLVDPVAALEHWKTRLKPGGVLFLYLPHPDMEYWLPQNNRKHLHQWRPADVAKLVADLGFSSVIHSERDLCWSFSVVGFASG